MNRRVLLLAGALATSGCLIEAGVRGGVTAHPERRFSWGNHALAMVAPHPMRLGVEFSGLSAVDRGNRWAVGVTSGVAFRRSAPRPLSMGTELRADLGVPLEGVAFGPRGEWYYGATFEATFWWWRRHEGADLNRGYWLANIIPEVGLFGGFRVYRERDANGAMGDLVNVTLGISIRLKIASDLVGL